MSKKAHKKVKAPDKQYLLASTICFFAGFRRVGVL